MRVGWALVVVVSTLVPISANAQLSNVAARANVANPDTANGGLVWTDFDGDGDLDAVVNTNGRSFLFQNDGAAAPTFTDVTVTHALGLSAVVASGEARSIVSADMNHDGLVDLVRARINRIELFLNRGPDARPPFSFGDDAQLPNYVLDDTTADGFAMNAEGVAVIDVDGDGWLDIILQNDSGVRVLRNPADGSASFDYGGTPLDGVPTENTMGEDPDAGIYAGGDYVAVADFDVDGLVDLAARTFLGPDIYRQVSAGMFAAVEPDLPAPNSNKGSIVFCDLDADGDFDYLFSDGNATDPGTNHVWLLDSSGFSRVDVEIIATDIDGIDCGDLDNDGDLDVLLSGTGEKVLMRNTLMETGTFDLVAESIAGTTGNGEGVVLGDYDRDGDLDAMVVQNATANLLLENDTNDDNYLIVRLLADVGSCATGRVLRDDIGGVAILRSVDGTSLGAREVNGGQGHGSQGTSLLHFGLPSGPTTEYALEARFQYGDVSPAIVRVTPSELGAYQMRTIVSTDPDGDGILTSDEILDAAGVTDLDGDGLPNWLDEDADGDGVSDADESGDGDPCTAAVDLDANGVLDYLQPQPLSVDAGVPMDGGGGGVDGGVPRMDGGPNLLEAHGSGCARCAVTARGRGDARHRAMGFVVLVIALTALRRRSRRSDAR